MAHALLVASLLLQAWVVRAVVAFGWTGDRAGDRWVRLGVACALWSGVVALGAAVAMRAGWSGTGAWAGHALVGAVLLPLGGATRRGPGRQPARPAPGDTATGRTVRRLLGCAAAVAAAAAVVGAALHVAHHPHGGYDAWWMWNTKARVLATHDGSWAALAATMRGVGHPDYPLLLPSVVATSQVASGAGGVSMPIVVSCAFAVATVVLVVAAVRAERSWVLACIALTLLCGYHRFVAAAVEQTADLPFALFLVAALLPIHRALASGAHAPVLLAGAFLGCGAWTKNEGLLALVVGSIWKP